MKKNLLIVLGLFCAVAVMANGPYEKAMAKNVPAVFSSSDLEQLQGVINQLDRIGEAEGDRWEPYYYASFGYLRMSGMVQSAEDKDKFLDLALASVEKGEVISSDNSELEAMRGYVHMIRITVDPATRGMTYSGMAFTSFQKAVKLDPENPRAHFLLGRMQHGTAQFMGGGNEEACGSLFKALTLFTQAEQDEQSFAPSWGQGATQEAIKEICEKGN